MDEPEEIMEDEIDEIISDAANYDGIDYRMQQQDKPKEFSKSIRKCKDAGK